MRPIRGQVEHEVIHDPWNGAGQVVNRDHTAHVLSDAGAIESYRTKRRVACICGCLQPPGGHCAVCGGIVCVGCFRHCMNCGMPLCPRHMTFVQRQSQSPGILCASCHQDVTRKRVFRGIGMLLLSPFITFRGEDRDDHA